jgi:hypothetical protein
MVAEDFFPVPQKPPPVRVLIAGNRPSTIDEIKENASRMDDSQGGVQSMVKSVF